MCSATPVYGGFAHLTQEQALAKSDSGPRKVSNTPDHLMLTSVDAPAFCKRAEFLFSPGHQIVGFAVFASRADDLDVTEVLQRADRFDFTGGPVPHPPHASLPPPPPATKITPPN